MGSVKQAMDRKELLSKSLKELFESYTPVISTLGENVDFITKRISYTSISSHQYISTENLLSQCRGYSEYSGSPITTSIMEYKKNDILLSNIRPYLSKMILASMDGGCSPDVLVIRSKNEKKISPKFLYLLLANTGFFEHIMTDIKGMKMPRGKIETIKRFRISLPEDFSVQEGIAREAEDIFKQIIECDNIIETSDIKISEIVSNYIL